MKQLLKHMRDVAGVVTMACVVLFVPMAGPTGAATIHHPYWIDDIQGAITFYKGGGYYKKAYPALTGIFISSRCRSCGRRMNKGIRRHLCGHEPIHGHAGGFMKGAFLSNQPMNYSICVTLSRRRSSTM